MGTTSTSWSRLLDAFERSLDRAEAAARQPVRAGTGESPAWRPGREPPSELPTADELARLRELRARQQQVARALRRARRRRTRRVPT